MDWKLTITKGVVVGVLASIGVWIAEAQQVQAVGNVAPYWVGLAIVALETVRDIVKDKFGAFA